MVVSACGMTHAGLRRGDNEDFFLMEEEVGLFAVADGLGGEPGGEIASRAAAESVGAYFAQLRRRQPRLVTSKMIDAAVDRAHKAVVDAARSVAGGRAGTTLVFALRQPSYFWVANVGDSRCYLVRDGAAVPVTQDHSLVARMVEKGKITPEEARVHPLRNIVTRSLGIDIGGGCHKKRLAVRQGDRLILCSDGLWEMLTDAEIGAIAAGARDVKRVCTDLIDAANAAGGRDNVTVVALFLGT
ncbi:MAG: PP2C family protein-serine/threonine phosphatase [Deltaproteobacteria bacterium]